MCRWLRWAGCAVTGWKVCVDRVVAFNAQQLGNCGSFRLEQSVYDCQTACLCALVARQRACACVTRRCVFGVQRATQLATEQLSMNSLLEAHA